MNYATVEPVSNRPAEHRKGNYRYCRESSRKPNPPVGVRELQHDPALHHHPGVEAQESEEIGNKKN